MKLAGGMIPDTRLGVLVIVAALPHKEAAGSARALFDDDDANSLPAQFGDEMTQMLRSGSPAAAMTDEEEHRTAVALPLSPGVPADPRSLFDAINRLEGLTND